ncbi:MAG: hypothetical protein MJ240_01610 [Kiritimatiellae bacterium]|nr:hypothetical protein [Kiritimatiellia bacterium]
MRNVIVVGLALWAAVAQAGFEVGFSRVDVTPPLGTELSGYFHKRVSDGVLDTLQANALAFSDGTNKAVVISVDVISLRAYAELYRAGVAKATGLPPEAIFLSATHTHTGPVLGVSHYGDVAKDFADANTYVRSLGDRLASAAQLALTDLAPATIAVARGEAKNISFIRRYRMKDGSVRTNPGLDNPQIAGPIGAADEEVQLVRFDREGREAVALVNFQCHPDTIGGNKISADWPREVRETVERALNGVKCVCLNGAQGDTNHICTDSSKNVPRGRNVVFRHMGRKIAGAAIGIWDECVPVNAGAVRYAVSWVRTASNRPKASEIPEARRITELAAAGKDSEIPGIGMQKTTNKAWARRVMRLIDGPDFFELPISTIVIGDALAFAGFPGEPFTAYGLAVKKGSPYKMTLPACLTNGSYGYLPVASAFAEGGYEARSSFYTEALEKDLVGGQLEQLKRLLTH